MPALGYAEANPAPARDHLAVSRFKAIVGGIALKSRLRRAGAMSHSLERRVAIIETPAPHRSRHLDPGGNGPARITQRVE
jgi:hypothetical protein